MYKTNILSGNKRVVSSGTVISFDNNPIFIEVLDEAQSIAKLQFIFNDDTTIKEQSMSIAVVGDVLCFTLTNFNNPIGTGTTRPINFAKYGDIALYLHLRVTALNNTDRTLYFTIYSDGGENSGTN